MKRSPLGAGQKSLERGSTFSAKPTEMKRSPSKPGRRSTLNPGRGFAASPAQRAKIRFAPCVRCGVDASDPMHLIDRSLVPDPEGDPRRVVPGCRGCHDLYDGGNASLLEHLEPHYRAELAHAVELVGLITALERITNRRWREVEK